MTINKADLNGKNILFIAYFYPPVASTNIPGAMRTIKFIRNLENGECHVLTTPPVIDEKDSALNHLSLPVDREIIHRIESWDIFKLLLSLRSGLKKLYTNRHKKDIKTTNSSQPVFKTTTSDSRINVGWLQKFKDFIYNLCYFPDQAGPWILPAYLKGKKIVQIHNLDIIFATGSPWSDLLVGYFISKATGKPLIIDFRDPWMNNPFHQSKGKFLDNWSTRLEKKMVEHAAAISLNTQPLMNEFLERYRHIPPDRFFVLPNGFDKTDFIDLEPLKENYKEGIITLCHAGFLYGVRDPAVLLDSIMTANDKLNSQQRKIRFIQIGDIQLDYDVSERYATMIEDGSLILEPPSPYQKCLRALSGSDWVVNIQPATKSQVPSKLYDYLGLNRPILSITPKDGALGCLISKHNLGELFDFNDKEALSIKLVEIAESHNKNREFTGYPARAEFDCEIIAEHLAQRISQLIH